jgi:two-component system sensor histidine kinase KdpD
VETPRDQRLTAEEREDIVRALELAEQLGGRAVTLSGQSVADEILAYARDHNVTRIVTGKTRRPRWRDLFEGSLLDALVRGSGDIELLAITGLEEDEAPPRPSPPAPRHSPARDYVAAVAIVVIPTVVGMVVRKAGIPVPPIDASMLYLLAVVVASARFRRGPALAASLVGIASFDYFFVHPFYTFSVTDVRYVLTFGVMLLVALVMGNLTGRIRNQAEAAREREQRTSALYALSRELATARDREAVVAAALRSLRDTFALDGVVLLPDDADGVSPAGPAPYPLDERERAVAQWSFDHGQAAGRGTTTLRGSLALYLPLSSSGPGRAVGVIGLPLADPAEFRDPGRRRLLESLAGQTAVALERLLLAERSRKSEVEVEAERLRTALLSSLSHDMRTPLASIEGAASTMLQETEPDRADRRELATTIVQESHRMGRLVANLLDMIRVEAGTLQVRKEWQLLADAVGVALLRTEEQLRDHPVMTNFPAELPLVPIDEILLEQVFVNLLENAAKHTPPGTPIDVGAEARPREVIVYVADRGPGLPPGEEETIFDKFHRGGTGAGGIGLGLTISRGIVTAHGGRIWAENRPGGGAVFRVSLPITGTPPQLLTEEPTLDRHDGETAGAWTAQPRSSS